MYFPKNSSRLGASNNVTVATTSTSAASSAFGAQTYQIRVAAPAACYFKIDAGTPTAAATDAYLPANVVEYIKVQAGQKIAVFSATTQAVSVVEVSG